MYPNVLYYGWHFYRDNGGSSTITNCVMNAANTTAAIGVYAYDGPSVCVAESSFINFPTNSDGFATCIRHGTNIVTETAVANTNLSWAGYPIGAVYSTTEDSDGDGLSDYDEIHVYDTDPLIEDSDGDELTDAEEVYEGTDPKDLYSFYRRVTVVTTAKDDLSDMTNYVAWGTSASDWETNGMSCCWTFPTTNVYDMLSSSGLLYVKSFRLCATVNCVDSDAGDGITNYLGMAESCEGDRVTFTTNGILTIDMLLTNGVCEVFCLRDFNGNGAYDAGADVLYSRVLTKSDNGKTVAFVIGDSDSDGQADSSERAQGTNPADARSYCFNLSIVENGIFSTTNSLSAEILFGTNVVVGPIAMTNRIWEVDVGHLVTSNRETVVAYFWDDANSNGVRDADECDAQQTLTIKGHDNILTNTLSFGTFDRDNDGMLDYWELLHADAGLSPTNATDAFIDADSDGLINLHEYWTHCDPFVPDGSNTVLSVMARSVDDLLTTNAIGRIDKFSVYNEILNTNCWAHNIDTSCASANNTHQGRRRAGTAISPWHVAVAAHYYISNGCYIDFISNSGVKVRRKIKDGKRVAQTDIYILLLESMLPASINPAKILPDDYYDYIRTGRGLPVLMYDYDEHTIVNDLDNLPIAHGSVNGFKPINSKRLNYFEDVVSGDSGDPKFLVVNNAVILISTLTSYGRDDSGVGPSYQAYACEIQSVMDELSDRNAYPRSNIKRFDFSAYNRLEN